MDFKQFFQVIRRRWKTIVAFVALALGICGFIIWRTTPLYESKAQVFISVTPTDATSAATVSFFVSSRVTTYATLATSTKLMETVIQNLDLDVSPEQLAERVSAEVVPENSIIEVKVRDEDPREAQQIATSLSDEYSLFLAAVETPTGTDAAPISASITEDASYDADPVTPKTVLYLAVAGLLGMLIGLAVALTRQILDRTISAQDHIKEVTAAPVLASVGFDKEIGASPLLTNLGSFAPRTEAFRLLRTNLQFLDLDEHPRCLVISSAIPGEGKTMTSTNLAIALAQTGRRTLVIDADLRRPRVAGLLGLDAAVGLTTILVGKADVQDAIQLHEPSGLHFLASGAKPPNPTEILQSRVTHDLVRQLRDEYDMVIIDAPPLLPVADASVLAALADGVIMVVKHGRTTRDQLGEAIARLNQVGGRLFGVVVNMIPKRSTNSYYYYYYEENDPPGRRKS